MLGPLVVVALGFQLPGGRQLVTGRAAGVAMSGRQDAETYLKSTTGPDAKVALDDATRDAEPRLDGRVDDPAAKPTAAQSQAYQAALESGPPSGSVPVAYQSTAPPQAQPETAYDRFMRAKAASPPVVAGPVGWSPPADTAAAVATPESPLSTRAVRVLGPLALFAGSVAGTLAVTSISSPAPITFEEVIATQRDWGDAIVRISKTYLEGGDYVAAAAKAADELYGYGRTDVLFKPTKAAETPFRPTGSGALSYFVGGDKVTGGYAEDAGFALGPNGVGWKKVVFDNNKIDLNGPTATAMGEYYFTSTEGDVAKVEYTFGYKRNKDGKLRIYLHHSSLPYPGKKKPAAPAAPKA